MALLLAGVVLLLVELGGRELGFRPQVKDSPELWSWVRTRANEGDGRAVVLLGSSRFQTGLVPEELSKVLGGAPVLELAINASSSLPVLEDLAADEHFRGRVLCEVSPTMFFSVGPTPEPLELEALLERVASAVERIRSRGGDVIFVRMVTSGTVRHIEDELYPRPLYWDRLILRTGKGLTFEDVPALERLSSPDGSHLDYASALEFTRVLARETLLSEAPSTLAQDTP